MNATPPLAKRTDIARRGVRVTLCLVDDTLYVDMNILADWLCAGPSAVVGSITPSARHYNWIRARVLSGLVQATHTLLAVRQLHRWVGEWSSERHHGDRYRLERLAAVWPELLAEVAPARAASDLAPQYAQLFRAASSVEPAMRVALAKRAIAVRWAGREAPVSTVRPLGPRAPHHGGKHADGRSIHQIARLLASGCTQNEIAGKLKISGATVSLLIRHKYPIWTPEMESAWQHCFSELGLAENEVH